MHLHAHTYMHEEKNSGEGIGVEYPKKRGHLSAWEFIFQ